MAYRVPGYKSVIAQPSPMSDWATVYTMMLSWKNHRSLEIRRSVAAVAERCGRYYDASVPPHPRGLPASECGPFLRAARMSHEPMVNYPFSE